MNDTVIEVSGLVKRYQTKQGGVLANNGIDIIIGKGERIGLLGPNGSGKTTFVRQLTGYLRKTEGNIKLFGTDVAAIDDNIRNKIGYLMQSRYSHWDHLKVKEAIGVAGILKKLPQKKVKQQIEFLLDKFDLQRYKDIPLGNLSGGNKQAVGIAITLINQPELIILDEPSNGLDPIKRKLFWTLLNELIEPNKTTLLIISHHASEIEQVADKVIIFDEGKIIHQGQIKELKDKLISDVRIEIKLSKNLEEVLREEQELFRDIEYINHNGMLLFYCPRIKLPKLISSFVNANVWHDFQDFQILNPTLEDLYIKLIGKKMD